MDSNTTMKVLETVGDVINALGGATVCFLLFVFILTVIEIVKRQKNWDGEK